MIDLELKMEDIPLLVSACEGEFIIHVKICEEDTHEEESV